MTEQEQPHVAPGHRVPDAEWAAIVRRAQEVREQIQQEAGGGASSGIAPVVDMTAAGVRSRKYFPVSGRPTQLLVLHSAECPLRGGYARSLTEWASSVYPSDPVASWQRFVDPLMRLRFVPDELGAWHASEANPVSIGWEQAGYARYSREEWLTQDGQTQLESLAFDMAEVAVRDGIPARWLTTAEVRAVLDHGNTSIKGFCFHWQIDPETRTDPGGGYPADLLMERIRFYINNGNTEEDMPTLDEIFDYPIARVGGPVGGTTSLRSFLAWWDANNDTTRTMIKDSAAAAVNAVLQTEIGRQGGSHGGTTTLAATVAYLDGNLEKILNQAGLEMPQNPVDTEAITAAVNAAVRAGLENVSITLTNQQRAQEQETAPVVPAGPEADQ